MRAFLTVYPDSIGFLIYNKYSDEIIISGSEPRQRSAEIMRLLIAYEVDQIECRYEN